MISKMPVKYSKAETNVCIFVYMHAMQCLLKLSLFNALTNMTSTISDSEI